MQVVINTAYDCEFRLSISALRRYAELTGSEYYFYTIQYVDNKYNLSFKKVSSDEEVGWLQTLFVFTVDDVIDRYKDQNSLNELYEKYVVDVSLISRTDPALVQVVNELKEKAGREGSILKVVEIPDDVEWEIEEREGVEWVSEKHRIWC